MCRYSSNVTHVCGGAGDARGCGGARRARVCVRPGRGRGRFSYRRGRPVPADRTPSRYSAFARHRRPARSSRSSLRVREPPATHVRADLAPIATLETSGRNANRAVLPNFTGDSVHDCCSKNFCVNSNGIVQCEDRGPAGRRFFERRKGWGVRGAQRAEGGARPRTRPPRDRAAAAGRTRVHTGARDGRQADRRGRRGALQPALEQSSGAPAALLRGPAACRDPCRRYTSVR